MAVKTELDSLALKEFARRLYVLRVSKQLSRAELARKSGVAIRSIADSETAKRFPTLSQCVRLADALGVRVSYLFDLAKAPRIVSVYPTLREAAEMLVAWVDSHPLPSELPLDLLRALRSKATQEKVRAYLKLEIELPEVHRDVLQKLEAAQVATFPPVRDSSHRTSPLG